MTKWRASDWYPDGANPAHNEIKTPLTARQRALLDALLVEQPSFAEAMEDYVRRRLLLVAGKIHDWQRERIHDRVTQTIVSTVRRWSPRKGTKLLTTFIFQMIKEEPWRQAQIARQDNHTKNRNAVRLNAPSRRRHARADTIKTEKGAAFFDKREPRPEHAADASMIRAKVERFITRVARRHAEVLRLRYGIGAPQHSLAEAAEKLGITRLEMRRREIAALVAIGALEPKTLRAGAERGAAPRRGGDL